MAAVLLGFDYGLRRIGVALGNGVTRGARPLRIVDRTPVDASWNAIAALIGEWGPDRLVVGIPRHPDGSPHEMTARCERFARQLEGRFRLPVDRVDERYTSAVLEGTGPRDDEAAALILQQWFDEKRILPSPLPLSLEGEGNEPLPPACSGRGEVAEIRQAETGGESEKDSPLPLAGEGKG